jgi:hypothetical protein
MPSLALIFHLCEILPTASPPPVTLDPARCAAAWCDYLEAHARRIFHSVTARVDTAARLLGEKIKARKLPNPFTPRDVYRAQWTGLSEPADVTRALEQLEGLAWVVMELLRPAPAGGRPSLRCHVNPKVWTTA